MFQTIDITKVGKKYYLNNYLIDKILNIGQDSQNLVVIIDGKKFLFQFLKPKTALSRIEILQ